MKRRIQPTKSSTAAAAVVVGVNVLLVMAVATTLGIIGRIFIEVESFQSFFVPSKQQMARRHSSSFIPSKSFIIVKAASGGGGGSSGEVEGTMVEFGAILDDEDDDDDDLDFKFDDFDDPDVEVDTIYFDENDDASLERPSSSLSSSSGADNNQGQRQKNEETEKNKKPSQRPVRRYQSLKKEPLIAIIGRPNVGKSALVNRLAGSHQGGAIVADEEGITRDRTYRQANFLGENFQIVDTGGLVFDDDENTLFAKQIREQAMVAIDESSAVILVVDGQVGLTSMDSTIADFLRKQVLPHMPVLVAVNKCESETVGALNAAEFWNLGLGEPVPVSALHGVGTADTLERIFDEIVERKTAGVADFGTKVKRLQDAKIRMNSKKQLPGEDEVEYKMRKYGIGDVAKQVIKEYEDAMAAFDSQERPEEINIAIVGRPNVGKSSLLNAIFGDTRAIVSEMAGTTRDSIDAVMERPAEEEGELPTIYRFVDTAGIRRKGKVEFGPEFFMVNRALRAIRRADVALLILDATAGVTEQDRILAQKIADDGRACAIICNKWDAVVDKDSSTYDKSVKYIRAEMPQIRWAPILFISAETGQRVGKIYNVVDEAIGAHRKRVSTSILNEVLRDAILWQPPPARRNGAQAKIYYCNQVSTRPPTIVVFCNDPKLVNDNYRRYLDRKFRESLDGFEATPIRWLFRGRRQRDIMRARDMNGNPGDGGAGVSYPFPHAD